MADVKAISAVGRGNTSTKKTTPQRDNVYTVKSGDNLTQISKKFGMTLNEFKAWTGLKSDTLSINQKINLPQSKVPESKGIMTLASKYNMDFEAFCRLNNIPKPYKQYVAGKDEMFYVFKDYGKTKTEPKKAEDTNPTKPETPKTTPKENDSKTTTAEKTKVTLNNGKTFTAKELREDAIKYAKKDPHFAGAKTSYIQRPLPNIVNGKIEATAEVQKPTSEKGSLKGKVVILNSGHGGYNQNSGSFDSGAVSTRADAKGDMVPVEEWKVARSVTDYLATKLRAQGATVIIVSGAVKNGGMAKQHYLEDLLAGTKGPADVRTTMKNTKKSDMMFLSIHFDSAEQTPEDKRCTVRAYPGDQKDKTFTQNIQNEIRNGFTAMTPKMCENDYYVTSAMGSQIPAALLEVGNIFNEDIHRTALSSYDLNKYADCLYKAIDITFNTPKPKKK